LAVEVGPITAERLVEMCGEERIEPFRAFLGDFPLSFPFFWWGEEVEMLLAAVEEGYAVWGLDQEFIGSGRYLLERLHPMAPDDAARDVTARCLAAAWKGYESGRENSNSAQAFLSVAEPGDFDELESAYAEAGPQAQRIVHELRESARVYQLFQSGENYASNLQRVRLMKRHLVEAVRDFDPEGRILMKFGNMHLGRGYSRLNLLDLGNHAAELAAHRGGDSFHLAVLGLSREEQDGTVTDYRPEAPELRRFEAAGETGWAVFDLRELRPSLHDSAVRPGDGAFADLVWRYDAALVIPRMNAARRIDE
jgi:hypothetical protein